MDCHSRRTILKKELFKIFKKNFSFVSSWIVSIEFQNPNPNNFREKRERLVYGSLSLLNQCIISNHINHGRLDPTIELWNFLSYIIDWKQFTICFSGHNTLSFECYISFPNEKRSISVSRNKFKYIYIYSSVWWLKTNSLTICSSRQCSNSKTSDYTRCYFIRPDRMISQFWPMT